MNQLFHMMVIAQQDAMLQPKVTLTCFKNIICILGINEFENLEMIGLHFRSISCKRVYYNYSQFTINIPTYLKLSKDMMVDKFKSEG